MDSNLNDLISYRSSLVYESIDRACRWTDPDSCGNKSGDLEGNRCHWRPTSWRKFLGQSIRRFLVNGSLGSNGREN